MNRVGLEDSRTSVLDDPIRAIGRNGVLFERGSQSEAIFAEPAGVDARRPAGGASIGAGGGERS